MLKKSKTELFRLMKEYYGMDDAKVRTLLKAAGVAMPFDVENWDAYIKALTGRAPCEYCGAPVEIQFGMETYWKISDRLVCVEGGMRHYYMRATERLIEAGYVGQGMTLEDAKARARRFCLTICKHEELLFSCLICIEERVQFNTEEVR